MTGAGPANRHVMACASDRKVLAWWGPAVSALTLGLALVRLGGATLWLDERDPFCWGIRS